MDRTNFLIWKGADVGMKENSGLSALHMISKYVPECLKTYEKRLDAGIDIQSIFPEKESTYADFNSKEEINPYFQLNFRNISTEIEPCGSTQVYIELQKLNSTMSEKIIEHPLSQAYLHIKWNKIKYFYIFFNIIPHLIFSLIHSAYILHAFVYLCKPLTEVNRWNLNQVISCSLNGSNESLHNNNLREAPNMIPENQEYYYNLLITLWIVLMLSTSIFVCKQITMIFFRGKQYFTSCGPYITWPIITFVLMSSFLINPFNDSRTISFYRWQYHVAAIGCLYTWYKMLLFIGHLPFFGKYVDMFR